jgi:hypothetical protein
MSNWDWVTISALATAFGTLILALATFAAVRSANRNAVTAERAFSAALRPVLVAARADDPEQRLGFADGQVLRVQGPKAAIEARGDAIYMAIAMRNVGPGLAVLDRWAIRDGTHRTNAPDDIDAFRRLSLDLYIAPGDVGYWQGALREPGEPDHDVVATAVAEGQPFRIDVLYGDHEGGQHTISRFSLSPKDDGLWSATVVRHWNLDRPDPR